MYDKTLYRASNLQIMARARNINQNTHFSTLNRNLSSFKCSKDSWKNTVNLNSIELLLIALLGIEYYEKNVANQLIEFMHYYVTETV